MAAKNVLAGLQVTLTANTTPFATEMDKAAAKARFEAQQIRKELAGIKSEAVHTEAMFKEAFGIAIPRHLRGVIAEMPGVGKALSAAFSGVAILVFIRVLAEAYKKVKEIGDALREMGEKAEKNREVWGNFSDTIRTHAHELERTKARLDEATARLEHKPVNYLATALWDARVNADKLADSLDAVIEKAQKALLETKLTTMDQLLNNKEENTDSSRDYLTNFEKQYKEIERERNRELDDLVSKEHLKVGSDDYAKRFKEINADYDKRAYDKADWYRVHSAQDAQRLEDNQKADEARWRAAMEASARTGYAGLVKAPKDESAQAENLRQTSGVFEDIQHSMRMGSAINLQTLHNAVLEGKQKSVEYEETIDGLISRELSKLQQQVAVAENLRDIAAEYGDQKRNDQRNAEAQAKADAEILKLGQDLAKVKGPNGETRNTKGWTDQQYMDLAEKMQPGISAKIRDAQVTLAQADAQRALNEELSNAREQTTIRIDQAKRLTEAIAKGSEAVQWANAMTQAEAELHGKNATAMEIETRARQILDVQRAQGKANAAEINKNLQLEIDWQRRLNDALLQGADAYRAATLAKKQAEIDANDKLTPEEKAAEKQKAAWDSQAQSVTKVYEEAGKIMNGENDRLKVLYQELEILKAQGATAAQIKQVNDEIVKIQDEQAIRQGNVIAGMKGALDQMAMDFRNDAQIMQDALLKLQDITNDNLAKAMTGEKTNWKQDLKGLSQTIIKEELKNIEGNFLKMLGFGKADGSKTNPYWTKSADGMGSPSAWPSSIPGVSNSGPMSIVGSILGINLGGGKPDGTQGNPYYVVQTQGPGGSGGLMGLGGAGLMGLLGGFGGMGGGMADGSGIGTMVDWAPIDGAAAGGGDLSPFGTYLVGERGPEILRLGTGSGRVTPNHEIGGGGLHIGYIDARGTNAAEVDQRIRRGMEITHATAVNNSFTSREEFEVRRPRYKRF